MFKNKVCWVTGASSGIGKELCIQLSKAGAKVILSSRNEEGLLNVLSEMQSPSEHYVLPLNLEKNEEFDEKTKKIINKYGELHFLFNNGGISQRASAFDTEEQVIRKIMEVNFFGQVLLSKAVLPFFRQQKMGHFVILSSISGKFGFFLRSTYSASKHALHGYFESLALEENHNNIKVTLVCPGKINTPISLNALKSDGKFHGEMDDNQSGGMDVTHCVNKILLAVQKQKKEVLIGGKEIWAVYIKRFLPALFWKIIRKQKAV